MEIKKDKASRDVSLSCLFYCDERLNNFLVTLYHVSHKTFNVKQTQSQLRSLQ